MLSVFLVIGLALLLATMSSWVRGGSRPPGVVPASSADASATPDATDQLVMVVGPSAAEVTQAAIAFRTLYQDQNLVVYPFQAHAIEPNVTALTFPQDLPAELFYYLINYLSYPEPEYTSPAQV
jgi:hypothetical protein